MTATLNSTAVKVLTWLVYALMALLTIATSYLFLEQARMADKYVRLERYQSDTARIESAACRLESKFESFSNRVENKLDVLVLKSRE